MLVSGNEEAIFAIDADGCFCSLDSAPGESKLLSGLKERALFDVEEPLSRLVPLEGMKKQGCLLKCFISP